MNFPTLWALALVVAFVALASPTGASSKRKSYVKAHSTQRNKTAARAGFFNNSTISTGTNSASLSSRSEVKGLKRGTPPSAGHFHGDTCGSVLPSFKDIIWKENYPRLVDMSIQSGKSNGKGASQLKRLASERPGGFDVLVSTGDGTFPTVRRGAASIPKDSRIFDMIILTAPATPDPVRTGPRTSGASSPSLAPGCSSPGTTTLPTPASPVRGTAVWLRTCTAQRRTRKEWCVVVAARAAWAFSRFKPFPRKARGPFPLTAARRHALPPPCAAAPRNPRWGL